MRSFDRFANRDQWGILCGRDRNVATRAGGEIGRHAILRGWCRKACRFKSCPAHMTRKERTTHVRGSLFLFVQRLRRPPGRRA